MKHTSYGYGSYRGRGGAGAVLRVVIVVLAAVLVLAVAAFFYLQQYMVYSDDGTARLELPFLQRQEAEPTETFSAPPIFTPEPTPEPTPTVPSRPAAILPVTLPREALFDGTAGALVTEGGGTAALFDMKRDDGKLEWVSDQALAISAKASADDPAVNVAILATVEKEEGVYRIARVSCFKDHQLSTQDSSTAILTNSGYRWSGPDQVRWVSPTNETVRDYLTGLCQELAELGFDEILLDNAGYPAKGQLSWIRKGSAYNVEEFENVVSAFYRQVADALEETGVALSVVWDPEQSALTGQTEAAIKGAGATAVTVDETGEFQWPAAGG